MSTGATWIVDHYGRQSNGAFLVGDVTGDGIPDLQVKTSTYHTLFPGGALPTEPWVLPLEGYHSINDVDHSYIMYDFEAGDVDGDGLEDLGLLIDTPDASLRLFLGPFPEGGWTSIDDAAIVFEAEGDVESSDAMWAHPTYGALNLDGDGRADILVSNEDYGEWAYTLYLGGESEGCPLQEGSGDIEFLGDLDGDGLDDLWLNGEPGGAMSGANLRSRCGGPLVDMAFIELVAGEQWTSGLTPIGDWNGDGWNDLAIPDTRSDANGADAGEIFFFTGPYDGALPQAEAVGSWTGREAGDNLGYLMGAVDFDGDGLLDVKAGVAVCPGGQFPGPHELRPNCLRFNQVVVPDRRRFYDFNADGYDDLIFDDEERALTGIFRGFDVPWDDPTYW